MSTWNNKRVLITGGAGFLGSTLARRLVELGAQVLIVDSMAPGFGGNLFNLTGIEDKIRINFCDIRDRQIMNYLVKDQDVIFHAAGLNDHVRAITDPFPDLEVNIIGTTVLLEAIKNYNPKARVVYLGTRAEYGSIEQLPAKEDAPTNPKGVYEISISTAQRIFQFYHRAHKIPTTCFRITNVYGPRGQMQHNRTGVANWFVRLLLENKAITIMGDGKIMRDFVYVDDVIDALILGAASPEAVGELFNIGIDKPTSFLELAESMVSVLGQGEIQFVPMSAERAAQEPGHFYSDITKISKMLGWKPKTKLTDGLKATFQFYQQHRKQYWT